MPEPTIHVPDGLARTARDVHGGAGADWAAGLPARLGELSRRWGLTLGPPFPGLSYSYVAPARRAGGTEAVLKVWVPNPDLSCEIAALRLWDGRGGVRLLEADDGAGALLLERLRPGLSLWDRADDGGATAIAASVMGQLWRPAPVGQAFPSAADWAGGLARMRARFGGGTGPLPTPLVERAEGLFRDLLASPSDAVLLHGDLHHGNILSAARAPWLAIDPKGLIGEPAYETGAWLRNPLPGLLARPNPKAVLARRVAIFADVLGLDPSRVRGWGTAQAVMAAWWVVEDHGGGWGPMIACAELLAAL